MTESPIWIAGDSALAEACQLWSSADVLALDTEFVRTETYFARLGLIQVALDGRCSLIDPLTISDWSALVEILENPAIIKVFHSLSEDAEVLLNSTGARVAPVFDTQIAAALANHDLQMGFARLVAAEFDVQLPKEATRSDWLKRPLDAVQCEYAAADVYWLEKLFNRLAPALRDQKRFDWVVEDSNRAAADSLPTDPAVYYLRLRGAWKLKGERLMALQQLAQWRELQAREQDVNRSRILSDAEIIQVADTMPTSLAALGNLKGLHPRKVRLFGDAILNILDQAKASPREQWPARVPGPLPVAQADLMRDLKTHLGELAEQLSVPVEVLARRKQLEALVRSGYPQGEYQVPAPLQGWRQSLVAEPLVQYLEEQRDAADE
ncbi:ribonuclease D [Saccharospirillum sp. MSK14-1]|uniref:ribonuclease D n=1 Tax=Saccharospirillum sp. MSK14-1 TaxID=1897632 RepID=UPI0013049A3B|nr:ribonuclease D [Saccharospirillum sp. MSK14-1]